jgi:hypothetical protein
MLSCRAWWKSPGDFTACPDLGRPAPSFSTPRPRLAVGPRSLGKRACATALGYGRSDGSRRRPRRRGLFRRSFAGGWLSDSSVGSPCGRTRSGSTSALRSVTVSLRLAAKEGWYGWGRPTCDAGGSSCDPLFCDCAPGADGTIIVGSSCSLRPMIPPTPIVSTAPSAPRPRSDRQHELSPARSNSRPKLKLKAAGVAPVGPANRPGRGR